MKTENPPSDDVRRSFALPSFSERLLLKVLRTMSPHWRAHTDLFHDPYRRWVDWQSGLGEAARLLYSLAKLLKPAVVVEIGSSRGLSTCSFALACAENHFGHVFAIDPHTQNAWSDVGTGGSTYEFLGDRLSRYGLVEQCTLIRKSSRDAALDWNSKIDLLFIDGDHSFAGVREDFHLFSRWMNPDGLILFHDSAWQHHRSWESYGLEKVFTGGMGVPRYLTELQDSGYMSCDVEPGTWSHTHACRTGWLRVPATRLGSSNARF